MELKLALGITIIFFTMSACRLGNRVERPAKFEEWTFATEPTLARLCAHTATGKDYNCVDVDFNDIPNVQRGPLTNPVTLLHDIVNDEDVIYNKDNMTYLPTGFDFSTGLISFNGSSSVYALWEVDSDPCSEQVQLEHTGSFDRNGGEAVNGHAVEGRLEQVLGYFRFYTGDCRQSLADVHACIKDVNKCRQETADKNKRAQYVMTERFGYHLKAGAFTEAEMPELTEVHVIVRTK